MPVRVPGELEAPVVDGEHEHLGGTGAELGDDHRGDAARDDHEPDAEQRHPHPQALELRQGVEHDPEDGPDQQHRQHRARPHLAAERQPSATNTSGRIMAAMPISMSKVSASPVDRTS